MLMLQRRQEKTSTRHQLTDDWCRWWAAVCSRSEDLSAHMSFSRSAFQWSPQWNRETLPAVIPTILPTTSVTKPPT